MTADDFRSIALSMRGALEGEHMNHPDFRVNGRIFATLHADDLWGVVKLDADEQREFVRMHPKTFVPATGAWGRQGWTSVRLETADEATARSAVFLAWQHVCEQPSSRRSTKRAAGQRARRPRTR